MAKNYIEKRDGGFWFARRRVALDSIVYAHISGHSPESIREAFPVLSLEEVQAAIEFYEANRAEVEATFPETGKDLERLKRSGRERIPNCLGNPKKRNAVLIPHKANMKVRFLADANFVIHIVTGLIRREPQIDFQTADEAGLAEKTD